MLYFSKTFFKLALVLVRPREYIHYDVNTDSANSNLKMPKLKRASSAHVASQAKRRKKNQRELQHEGDLPRHQEQRRRERDAEAHRNARCDPVRRQQEQERNTDAH